MVSRNMPWQPLKHPKGPMSGAQYTTRQFAATFNNETGLSGLGGSTPGQLVLNSAVTALFSLAFELGDLNQVTTFGALFDQYRFERVRVHFKARNNALSVQNTASPNASVPTGYVVVDRDDSSAPSSLASLLEYDNVQSFNGAEDFMVDLVPSITPAVYSSGAFSGYGITPSNAMWVDVANTTIPCYGVKGGLAGLTATSTSAWIWDITAEYVISFRRTR